MSSTSTTSTSTSTTSIASNLLAYGSAKAGMIGIGSHPRAEIDAIILACSSSSDYFKAAAKKDAAVDVKIAKMKKDLQSAGKLLSNTCDVINRVNRIVSTLISARNKSSTKIVLDMDAFYFSCHVANLIENNQPLTVVDVPTNKQRCINTTPVCVGGGMVLTSNYEARKYGVRSAMAGFIGDKLVTQLSKNKQTLHHLNPNMEMYAKYSSRVKLVLQEYDPNLRMYSLDEAYMELGPYLNLRVESGYSHFEIQEIWKDGKVDQTRKKEKPKESGGDLTSFSQLDDGEHEEEESQSEVEEEENGPAQISVQFAPSNAPLPNDQPVYTENIQDIVNEMRRSVYTQTKLTCSSGIASNFLLAKIASDVNKPDGQCYVDSSHSSVMDFMSDRNTRSVGGIGRVMQKTLSAFGINTVGELFEERMLIEKIFSRKSAEFLLRVSLGWADGEDDNGATSNSDFGAGGQAMKDERVGQKGISVERTFAPTANWEEQVKLLEEYTTLICGTIKTKGIKAKNIGLKVKFKNFTYLSRQKEFNRFVDSVEDILPWLVETLAKLKKEEQEKEIRKVKNNATFSIRQLGVRLTSFEEHDRKSSGASASMSILGFFGKEKVKEKEEAIKEDEGEDRFEIVDDEVEDQDVMIEEEEEEDDGDEDVVGLMLSQQSEDNNADEEFARNLQKQFDDDREKEERILKVWRGNDMISKAGLSQIQNFDFVKEKMKEDQPRADMKLAQKLQQQYDREDEVLSRLDGSDMNSNKKKTKLNLSAGGKDPGAGGKGINSFFAGGSSLSSSSKAKGGKKK